MAGYVFEKDPTFWWEIDFELPLNDPNTDEKTVKFKAKFKFRRESRDESAKIFKQIRDSKQDEQTDTFAYQLLKKVVVDVKGIDGVENESKEDLLDRILHDGYFATKLLDTYVAVALGGKYEEEAAKK